MDEYQFWLLDLDGTLLTVEESYIQETIGAVGVALDRSFTDEEAVSIWYGRDGLRDDILEGYGIEPITFWDAFHRIESPIDRAAATRLHPDAEVVTELEGPIGVVTHCQSYLVEPILKRLDIEDWFDTVVTCSDEIGWKPDPAPLRLAMDQLRINGQSGAMVGDSIADIGAAKNAGVNGILVDREASIPPIDADRVVTTLWELR